MAKRKWLEQLKNLFKRKSISKEEITRKVAEFKEGATAQFNEWLKIKVELAEIERKLKEGGMSFREERRVFMRRNDLFGELDRLFRNMDHWQGFYIFNQQAKIEVKLFANDLRAIKHEINESWKQLLGKKKPSRPIPISELNDLENSIHGALTRLHFLNKEIDDLLKQSRKHAYRTDVYDDALEARALTDRAFIIMDISEDKLADAQFRLVSIFNELKSATNPQQISDALARINQAFNDVENITRNLLNNIEATDRSIQDSVKLRLGAVAVIDISTEEKPRKPPLSASAIAEASLEAAKEAGEQLLHTADTIECATTLGGCYIINGAVDAVMDNVIVPVAEPVVKHVVVPLVTTGITAGNKVGDMAMPVVNQVSHTINEKAIEPATDKLNKAFQEPARIADKASQPIWNLPRF